MTIRAPAIAAARFPAAASQAGVAVSTGRPAAARALRVKAGTMRPPIRLTRTMTASRPRRAPVINPSGHWPSAAACIAAFAAASISTRRMTGRLRHWRALAMLSPSARQSAGRKARSAAATAQPGSAAETAQAARPASQSRTSRASGSPAIGFAPVHWGTAVVRKR